MQTYKSILEKLFPSADIESLKDVPREKLLELTASRITFTAPLSPSTSPDNGGHSLAPGSEDGGNLEYLERMPDHDLEWDESRRKTDRIPIESDDVNGLSMRVDKSSSYLGISSIMAVFRVLVFLDPSCATFLAESRNASEEQSRAGSPCRELKQKRSSKPHETLEEGAVLINAYFEHIHALIPILDEALFRRTYFADERKDECWLALLNIVLAMGSIAACASENKMHEVYFRRARQYLDLEAFGSGHLETLQALAIMGGETLLASKQCGLHDPC